MKYTTTEIGGTVEILAANDFTAIPITITETTTVKAGMPVSLTGKKQAAGSSGSGETLVKAAGILLYDVDPTANPNGALVVAGVVDWAKCKSNSGATATAATMKGILPAIEFRENIGVNEDTED